MENLLADVKMTLSESRNSAFVTTLWVVVHVGQMEMKLQPLIDLARAKFRQKNPREKIEFGRIYRKREEKESRRWSWNARAWISKEGEDENLRNGVYALSAHPKRAENKTSRGSCPDIQREQR